MSSIPAVLAALTALAEATVTADWLVINGPVGAVETTKGNLVTVGDGDVVGSRELDSMTFDTSAEQYVVPWTVSAFISGSDQQAADALALDMLAALERAIREYPGGATLGVAGVLKALPIGPFTMRRAADAQARYTAISSGVDIFAQIS